MAKYRLTYGLAILGEHEKEVEGVITIENEAKTPDELVALLHDKTVKGLEFIKPEKIIRIEKLSYPDESESSKNSEGPISKRYLEDIRKNYPLGERQEIFEKLRSDYAAAVTEGEIAAQEFEERHRLTKVDRSEPVGGKPDMRHMIQTYTEQNISMMRTMEARAQLILNYKKACEKGKEAAQEFKEKTRKKYGPDYLVKDWLRYAEI